MDWYWVKVCDDFRCAAMKTGIVLFVEHTEIVKEVNVFVDGSITIFLGNISIDPITIGLPKKVKDSSISMWDYLQLVGKCKVCLGKETTKTYKGCHRTQHGDSHDFRCVSSGCQSLLPVITQSSISTKCYSQHTAVLGDGTSPSTSPNGPGFIPDMPENEQRDFNADEVFSNLFPNVSNDLLDLLYSQVKCSQAETLGVDAKKNNMTSHERHACCLQSPGTRLFVPQLVHGNNNETSETFRGHITGPLWRESTGNLSLPLTKGQ